jgi:hypothetical protein
MTLEVALALDPLAGIALVIGVASVLLPRDWVTGIQLERDATTRTRLLRAVALGAVFPASVVFLVAAGFSPFLYFQF